MDPSADGDIPTCGVWLGRNLRFDTSRSVAGQTAEATVPNFV